MAASFGGVRKGNVSDGGHLKALLLLPPTEILSHGLVIQTILSRRTGRCWLEQRKFSYNLFRLFLHG